MRRHPEADAFEHWAARFERESPIRKAALVGATAVRLTAGLIERTLRAAAATVADAERALKRELDPSMEEAKILEERPKDEG